MGSPYTCDCGLNLNQYPHNAGPACYEQWYWILLNAVNQLVATGDPAAPPGSYASPIDMIGKWPNVNDFEGRYQSAVKNIDRMRTQIINLTMSNDKLQKMNAQYQKMFEGKLDFTSAAQTQPDDNPTNDENLNNGGSSFPGS